MGMDDDAAGPPADVKDAHTTDRMSAHSQRIEVITRGERRRRWSVEQARDCGGEPGARDIANHGGPTLRHQQWPALHVAATSAGRIAWGHASAGGGVRAC